MSADRGLEHSGDSGPGRAGQHAADQHGRQQDYRRPVMKLDAKRGARHRTRQQLALGADVEEPGPER